MQKFQINDVFWTFQGEGYNAGSRALFVRMPHCNLSCSWCDTEFDTKSPWTVEELASVATSEAARFAVVTGGEPLQNKETPLVIQMLHSLGFRVATETNGTMPMPSNDGPDWVTCSPKRDAAYKIHRAIKPHVDEYKYVVDEEFDFAILERHAEDQAHVRHYLSPEYTHMEDNLCRIYSYIKTNPRWRISLQTHKWMGVK